MGRSKTLTRLGIVVFMAAAMDQLTLHTLLADDTLFGRKVAPFNPPLFHAGQQRSFDKLASYVRTGTPEEASFHLDSELGWCPVPGQDTGQQHFDWAACRLSVAPLERQRKPGLERIITLGCSFTLGAEVEDHEAWPHQLDSRHEQLEFGNLAMSAYGLDQALMRYRRDGRPLDADEVWLGLMPVACLRVVSLYRPAQRHWTSSVVFKPRFRLMPDGELQTIPCPVKNPRELHDLLLSQEDFFAVTREDDLWVQRTAQAYAPQGSSWLHHSAIGRLLLTVLDSRGRIAQDWLRDESSEVYQLSAAICKQFAREVEADGARFRLILLPDRTALASIGESEPAYWAPLVNELRAAGIEVTDCSEACLEAGMLEGEQFWAPGGHYSAQGNRVIAEYLDSLLVP